MLIKLSDSLLQVPFQKKIKSLDVEKNDPVSSFKQNQLNKSLSTSEKKLQDFQF